MELVSVDEFRRLYLGFIHFVEIDSIFGLAHDSPNLKALLIHSTIPHKNIETNDKFYRKVAFLMYTEMVNFRP